MPERIVNRCDFAKGDYINEYFIDKTLGEGSFGKVFKVKDKHNQFYALKLLKLWEVHPDIRGSLLDRFEMEFETGKIQSDYLVHSYSYGYAEGNPYIIMEFCPNGDLINMSQKRRLDYVKVARQVLYGLNDLHKCGKVHRDLKPENVLVKQDGNFALTDFGISGDRNKRMTERNILGKPQQIFGTYAYMPPEQVNPKKNATVLPTTDIFSFGVMMYQLIAGKLPFGTLNDDNDLAVYLKNGKTGNWDRNALRSGSNTAEWEKIISGCLVPDFRNRLQTTNDVISLLPAASYAENRNVYGNANINIDNIKNGLMLRVMQGEEYGKVYRLDDIAKANDRCVLRVGRDDVGVDNDITITEHQSCYISRKHCTLELDEFTGLWYIRDGQWDGYSSSNWKLSMNGTYLNSREVSSDGLCITVGDIISIGDTKLRVEGY
ncbi:MAG: protein kinase [Bacteroidales bacterium]|nr:protein kinase [Bacteroidales bacterium]